MPSSGRVAVVGGGVMGCWTARWLRRRGHEVLLLDAYGPGSSVATSGDESRVTRSAHGPDEHYARWQRHAFDAWIELEADTGAQLLVRTGVLWFARGDDGFEAASFAALRRVGVPAERLEAAELADRYPQVDWEGIVWALHEPDGGALLARRAVAACASAFRSEGGAVRIAVAAPPSETDSSGGRLTRVHLADGSVLEADAFVYTCGPWLATMFPALLGGGELAVTRQEVIYFATPPGDGRFNAGRLPIWIDHEAAFYGIPSIEARGMKVAPDWPGPIVDPDRLERRISDESVDAARGLLRRRFPAMVDQPVAEGRVCQYETTRDANFIIDRHPAWSNVWVVGGGSGHGFKHGPSIGEYTAALVDGDSAAAASLAPPDDRFALRPRQPGPVFRTSAIRPSEASGTH